MPEGIGVGRTLLMHDSMQRRGPSYDGARARQSRYLEDRGRTKRGELAGSCEGVEEGRSVGIRGRRWGDGVEEISWRDF